VPPSSIDRLAALCAAGFIVVLGIAAYWDRTIRVLHLVESLPYGVAAILCLRRQKLGYILGATAGGFFLWMAGTLTTFIRNGFERIPILLCTGHVDRPDVLIAVPAAITTTGLVLFSLWGYSRLENKSSIDVGLFIAATCLVAAFFVAIFAAFAPGYLAIFKPLLARF
jgi:hypothetical protein